MRSQVEVQREQAPAGGGAGGRWRPEILGRWAAWVGYAAAVWSFAYGVLGLYWWAGGDGYPFAPIDMDHRSGSVLEGTSAAVGGPVMAGLGLFGAAAGVYMARRTSPNTPGPAGNRAVDGLVVFGWVVAVALTLLIPDYFLIALLAFAPLLVVFAFTGVPGEQDGIGDIIYWHRSNLLILFAGGLLWAAATLAYQRRLRGACVFCGRAEHGDRPEASRERLLRWGRRAVLVAVLAPLPYEVTRIAWYLGYPLGIPGDFLRMMQDTPGMLEVGLGCAVASLGGGVLTHGLVQGWGERYPRWIWFKAGRRVPPALAVVPASVVAVVLVPAGLMNVWIPTQREAWAVNVPSMLWIVWGVALGGATAAYHLRRRGACRRCGRGLPAGADG